MFLNFNINFKDNAIKSSIRLFMSKLSINFTRPDENCQEPWKKNSES